MGKIKHISQICCMAINLLLGAVLTIPSVYAAEESIPQAVENQETEYILDTIRVTARKIEENVQEVPISVTVIDENTIIDSGLEDMESVVQMTPGLNAARSPQSTASAFNIRGVGALGGFVGFEDGSVSAYIDGVPIPTGQIDTAILDVSQIEVLRGPQGTLYGKTSLAGAINIITTPPSDEFEGHAMLGIGTSNKWEIEGMITGPLIEDKINARLFMNASMQDGEVFNLATNSNLGEIEEFYGRATFDAKWSDTFNSRLMIAYDKSNNGDFLLADANSNNTVDTTADIFGKQEGIFAGLTNTLALSDTTNLNFVTGFNHISLDSDNLQPSSGAVPALRDTELHLNQEIRLDGVNGKLQWTTGVFASYFHRDLDHSVTNVPFPNFIDLGEQTATNLAVFGETTYAFTEQWKLTTGLRINYDEKTVDETVNNLSTAPLFPGGPNRIPFTHRMNESKDYKNWSGRAILAYLPSDNHTFFASLGRGYKPGAYQSYHNVPMLGIAANTMDTEESTSLAYELGYKGLFFAQRLNIDISLFYTDIYDDQILGLDPATVIGTYYSMDSSSYGIELASKAQITQQFSVGGNLSWTIAELGETQETSPAFPAFGLPASVVYEGAQLPYVPELAFNVFAEYRDELPWLSKDMTGFTRAHYAWQSISYLDPTHFAEIEAYGLLGLRMGIENETFRIIAYADNLTDEAYFTYGLAASPTLVFSASGRGRELGLEFTYFF